MNIFISAVFTVVTFVGLQYWPELSDREKALNLCVANRLLEKQYTPVAMLVNLAYDYFPTVILYLTLIYLVEMITVLETITSEFGKLVERLLKYGIYKGALILVLVVPPTLSQAGLWSTWLTVVCTLKMFLALARDRLKQLNASPSATPWTYFRVYRVLLLVFIGDTVWIMICLVIYQQRQYHIPISAVYLLLFFEPLSIAFETLQAILVHGFQLLDIWLHQSSGNTKNSKISMLLDMSAAGSQRKWEWKRAILRNVRIFLDIMTLWTAIGHYVQICRLIAIWDNIRSASPMACVFNSEEILEVYFFD